MAEGFDVGGAATGAASLATQMYQEVFKEFLVFREAIATETLHEHCRLLIELQHNRLESWALISQLDAEEASDFEANISKNEDLVVAKLSHLGLELRRLRSVELEHDFLEQTPAATPLAATNDSDMKLTQRTLRDLSEPGVDDSLLEPGRLKAKIDVARSYQDDQARKHGFSERCKESPRGTAKAIEQFKRFKWKTEDKSSFEESLAIVGELVDSLTRMLSHDQLTVVEYNTAAFCEMLLQLSSDVEEARALLDAAGAPKPSSRVSAPIPFPSKTKANTMRRLRARGKQVISLQKFAIRWSSLASDSPARAMHTAAPPAIEEAEHDHVFWAKAAKFRIDAARMDWRLIEETSSKMFNWDEQSTAACIPAKRLADGRVAWVEWKPFHKMLSQSSDKLEVPPETVDRIKKLVGLLQLPGKPRELCVPECLGYFQHPAKSCYGLVFGSPNNDSAPCSLLALYSRHTGLLSKRIEVAQQLSQWLLCFHTVNWVHKSLRSDSVLFFPNADKDLGVPYVGGYGYLRPAREGMTTMPAPKFDGGELYAHPNCILSNCRSCKTYDIYSLGVILVELAYWQPIEGIVKSAITGKTGYANPMLIQRELVKENNPFMRHIEATMGDKYLRATKGCLQSDKLWKSSAFVGLTPREESLDIRTSAQVRQAFIDEVVEPLKAIEV